MTPRFVVVHIRTLALSALILVCAFAVWELAAHAPGVERPRGPLSGRTIVIDPGHGGIDGGCGAGGVLEKGINLAVAERLNGLLQAKGATVKLTRDEDVALDPLNPGPGSRHVRDLQARVKLARQDGADLFVSLHVNASSATNARGIYTFYNQENVEGRRLATLVADRLAAAVGDPRRRVLPARFYVVRALRIPSTLVEMGFITNTNDRKLLTSPIGQQKVATALAQAIETYYLDPKAGLSQPHSAPAKQALSAGAVPIVVHPACSAL